MLRKEGWKHMGRNSGGGGRGGRGGSTPEQRSNRATALGRQRNQVLGQIGDLERSGNSPQVRRGLTRQRRTLRQIDREIERNAR